MKICFIIPSVSAGGIEIYLLRFLEYLGDSYNITVIVRGSDNGELKEKYLDRDLRLIFLRLGYVNPLRCYQYYRLFKHEAFDVVCDFNANFSGMSMYIARLAGIKKRISFYRQGRDHFRPGLIRNSVNRLLNRLVFRNATKILFNSCSAVEVFFPYRKKTDSRFEVIYNGIDPLKFSYEGTQLEARQKLGLPEDTFIIGHVGRNDPAKNHEIIFKTASELINRGADVHFVLCGSGTEKFKDEMSRYRLNGYMTILGYRDDVQVVLRSLNIFFFPSITEGQPNALIEAMLSGVPIIASNISSIKECVPETHWDFLCNPNDVECFLDQINKNMAEEQRENLVTWVKSNFNAEKNFRKFQNIIIE